MNIIEKLSSCRRAMKENGLDALIIPSSDPHQSEYVAERWASRMWISGFTGSAGTVVVTQNHAGLWTDSRYFLQAEEELEDSEFVLHKVTNQHTPQHIEWIKENLPSNSTVGVDGKMISQSQYLNYSKSLESRKLSLNIKHDIVNIIWKGRPGLPKDKIYEHILDYAGRSSTDKLSDVRIAMKDKEVDHHIITALDDIAWVLNIRGSDVESNPLVISFLIIHQNGATLYIDKNKIPADVLVKLENDGVTIQAYKDINKDLNESKEDKKFLVDRSQINAVLYRAINGEIIHGQSIIKGKKAIKNEVEIGHIRNVMVKDGAALANAFYWLDQVLEEREVSEVELSQKLIESRNAEGLYKGESFTAIVGYKGNGAIVHYSPEESKCAKIRKEGVLLVDSGGQYLDGTTDITRTLAMGTPTVEQQKNFTLVLKGNIALTLAKFPTGTSGAQLETLARQFLWNEGLNYLHGTGHGVGFFLNVHEGPQGFAIPNSERGRTAHVPGMLTSNEPGYYKEGEYGIRIENLVLTVEDDIDGFLSFDTVTLYPIDLDMIDVALLDSKEKTWLNKYHAEVYEKIAPRLVEEVRLWFKVKCRPL